VLRIADPKGNRVRGKLSSSKNLRRLLKSKLKQEWEKQVIDIIGGKVKIKSASKTKRKGSTKKNRPLKGFFPGGKRLYATYKGKDYKAWVYGGGSIKLNGIRYDNPSAAAKKIISRGGVNGWSFWKYKDKNGNLVAIKHLRK
jgi:hypothetical protein